MNNKAKRIISMLLALLMFVSLMPAAVFAEEATETVINEQNEEVFKESGELTENELKTTDTLEDKILPVHILFICEPVNLTLAVWKKAAKEAETEESPAQPIEPEKDGSYLLMPGEYVYAAECQGYKTLREDLVVTEKTEQVNVSLASLTVKKAAPKKLLNNSNASISGNIQQRLDALRQKFPDGRFWNHVKPAEEGYASSYNEYYADYTTDQPCQVHGVDVGPGCVDCNYFDGAWQCYGFANKVFCDLFGIRASAIQERDDTENLSVGDWVCLNNGSHYAVIQAIDGDNLYVVECNLDKSGAAFNCIINWGGVNQRSDVSCFKHATNYDEINGSSNTSDTTGTVIVTTVENEKESFGVGGTAQSQSHPEEDVTVFMYLDGDINSGKKPYAKLMAKAEGNHIFGRVFTGTGLTGTHTLYFYGGNDTVPFATETVNIPGGIPGAPDAGEVTYTVSYNANGGTGAPASQKKTATVDLTLSNTIPTRDGYNFIGWATSSTAGTAEYQPGGKYTKDADVTLYAIWKKGYIASGTCGENLTWTLDEEGTLTISGTGAMGDYIWLNRDAPWSSAASKITSIIFDDGVTRIGERAFSGCTHLTSVTIPSGVKSIGNGAFSFCTHLTSVIIPDSVTHIGDYAFRDCRLTSVIIPDSVTRIGDGAFYGCSGLTSVTIPDSVTRIGDGVFGGCNRLTEIAVCEGNTYYCSIDGVLLNKTSTELISYPAGRFGDYTIPDNVTRIGDRAFLVCILSSLTIPSSVTSIGDGTFNGCINLTDVYYSGTEVQRGNINIGSGNEDLINATWHYNGDVSEKVLESIVVTNAPAKTAYTEGETFDRTGMIVTATYSDGTSKTVTDYSFNPSGALKTSDTIITVAYEGKTATQPITVKAKAPTISGIAVTKAPTKIAYTEGETFDKTGMIVTATYSDGTSKTVADYSFSPSGALITNDTIITVAYEGKTATQPITVKAKAPTISGIAVTKAPTKIAYTEGETFDKTGMIVTATYSDGTSKTVADYSFSPSGALKPSDKEITVTYEGKTVTTPITVSYSSDTNGICGNNVKWTLTDGVLTISGTGPMYDYVYDNFVPSTAPWYEHNNSITSVIIENGVTSIGDRAFYGCNNLSSIEIPSSVVRIGNSAFVECDSLTSVTIPSNVTSIIGAFVACSNLLEINVSPDNSCYCSIDGILFNKDQSELICCPAGKRGSYVIPSSVRTIESGAFSGCSNLTSITIPSSVTSIGNAAFLSCSSLTSIIIPESVTSIGNAAFYDCSKLTSITIPESVISIGAEAFEYCSSLTNITIPSSVTSLGGWAFCWCTSLTNITIPSSVKSIGEITFASCTNLKNVTIMPGVTSIGYSAFICCSSLRSITIPESVTFIEQDAFFACDSLKDVYYTGTESQRGSINIGKNNDDLLNAAWHYESVPVILTGIEITRAPNKIVYTEGETFDKTGMVVTANYSDGTSETVTDYTVSPSEALKTSDTSITVTYEGKTATQAITVTAKHVHSFSTGWTSDADYHWHAATCEHTNEVSGKAAHSWNEGVESKAATHLEEGEKTFTCTVCGKTKTERIPKLTAHTFNEKVVSDGYKASDASCTEAAKYYYSCKCGEKGSSTFTVGEPLGHSFSTDWSHDDIYHWHAATCGHTSEVSGKAAHSWDKGVVTKEATATEQGVKTFTCTVCGRTKTETLEKIDGTLTIADFEAKGLSAGQTLYADGEPVTIDESGRITLSNGDAKTLAAYSVNDGNETDVHKMYPTSMKVWMIERNQDGSATAKYVEEFDGLLQYSGSSIRITGKKGIRMITSVPNSTRESLKKGALQGYTLEEYGTLLAWNKDLGSSALTLDNPLVKSNYAYRKGVADPVFKSTDSLTQYTNVLTFDDIGKCVDDLAMRPYMKLSKGGETITIYGGIVVRNIGYIAWQNRNAFAEGTEAYNYIWDIINYVYPEGYKAA